MALCGALADEVDDLVSTRSGREYRGHAEFLQLVQRADARLRALHRAAYLRGNVHGFLVSNDGRLESMRAPNHNP